MNRAVRLLAFCAIATPTIAFANCETCFLPRYNRNDTTPAEEGFTFALEYQFEYQDWDSAGTPTSTHGDEQGHVAKHNGVDHGPKLPIVEEEEEHEEGHGTHSHNRLFERFHHFGADIDLGREFSIFAHLPFIERYERQITGRENSNGVGDLDLLGTWKFLNSEDNYLGLVGGVKFATGDTDEVNSVGERFEPELQPGTGSTDVRLGFSGRYDIEPVIARGTLFYVIRNEGDQDYEFGDGIAASLSFEGKVIDGEEQSLALGVDSTIAYADRDQQGGETIFDSGGTVMLLGPSVTAQIVSGVSLHGAVLLPAIQDRGGDHQDLDAVYTVGVRGAF